MQNSCFNCDRGVLFCTKLEFQDDEQLKDYRYAFRCSCPKGINNPRLSALPVFTSDLLRKYKVLKLN